MQVYAHFFALRSFVLQNAGGFFDKSTTIFWTRRKNRIQIALRNNGIGARTHAGVVKDIKNIHTTNHIAIDEVFAFAAAVHTAPNGNLSEINGKRTVGVIEQ